MCQRASDLKGDEAKVESWMKSVGTFVSKTYTKYWHYRDVLAPFVVSSYSFQILIIMIYEWKQCCRINEIREVCPIDYLSNQEKYLPLQSMPSYSDEY